MVADYRFAARANTISCDMSDTQLAAEAQRRRTFAVINQPPDAGKSTLTEALALHARAITEAGAIHGKAGRHSTVSDWMEMERPAASRSPRPRCSSRTATASSTCSTPRARGFLRDTYRVLTAVDCAVMLIDAARGLEPQTLKLFQVCKHRGSRSSR